MHEPHPPTATTGHHHLIERAIRLWTQPAPDDEALHAFRQIYTDPVLVNGEPTDLQQLVTRACMLQHALSGIQHRIETVVMEADRLAIAFTLSGRHTGTLITPLGEIAATQRHIAVTGLDIFVLDVDTGHVAAVWATADWLNLIVQTGTPPDTS